MLKIRNFLVYIFFILGFIFITYYFSKSIFAKDKMIRNFDEPFIVKGFNMPLTSKSEEEIEEFKTKPNLVLKGTFIKEDPSVGGISLDFSVRRFTLEEEKNRQDYKKISITEKELYMDNYVKIDIENIGNHITDKNNEYDIKCRVKGMMYNEETSFISDAIYLEEFYVPKKVGQNKVSFVFKTIPGIENYNLEFLLPNSYPPQFNIEVTSAYTLDALGVDKETNLTFEETVPFKYERPQGIALGTVAVPSVLTRSFDLNALNYNDLYFKIDNKSKDEYVAFIYDLSNDIYNWRIKPKLNEKDFLYKEISIKPNSTLEQNFNNARLKSYRIDLVPLALKDDYLKIKELDYKIQLDRYKKGIDISEITTEDEQKLMDMLEDYSKHLNEIFARQEGNIYISKTK